MIWAFPLLFGIPKTFETSFLMQQSSQTQSILRLKKILHTSSHNTSTDDVNGFIKN